MSSNDPIITRRQALLLGGGLSIGVTGLSGCDKRAAVKVAKEVVKRLPWAGAVITAVDVLLDLVSLVLKVRAVVNGQPETIELTLTEEEAEALRNGGSVTIRASDGKQLARRVEKKE